MKPDHINAQNIMNTLNEYGFESLDMSEADFVKEGKVVQLGIPPVRINIMTSITGVQT